MSLFTKNTSKTSMEYASFLEILELPKLTHDMMLCDSMVTMLKNKSPGNDSITVEFYQFSWYDIKDFYINSIDSSQMKKDFSVPQR